MRIVNLCPHEIDLRLFDGSELVIPPSGRPARAVVTRDEEHECKFDDTSNGAVAISVSRSHYGEVVDLPDPARDTYYVVSYPVAYACPNRDDLLVPDDLVRDDRGVVVACRSLTRVTLAPS